MNLTPKEVKALIDDNKGHMALLVGEKNNLVCNKNMIITYDSRSYRKYKVEHNGKVEFFLKAIYINGNEKRKTNRKTYKRRRDSSQKK